VPLERISSRVAQDASRSSAVRQAFRFVTGSRLCWVLHGRSAINPAGTNHKGALVMIHLLGFSNQDVQQYMFDYDGKKAPKDVQKSAMVLICLACLANLWEKLEHLHLRLKRQV